MRDEDWFILRMDPRHTLRLATSLREDGFDVWTPIEQRKSRISRANVRRETPVPMLPTYIFVRIGHLFELLGIIELKRRMATRHVTFRLMRGPDNRIVGTADATLQGLRTLEQKRAPRRRAAKLPPGMKVWVKQEGGSFAGMTGKVIRSGEHFTLAMLDDRMKVELPTFMFVENDVRSAQVVMRRAA